MVSALILFGVPADQSAFDAYFDGSYVQTLHQLPHVRELSVHRVAGAARGASPFHLVVELRFERAELMETALNSTHGQAVASGLSEFASGGATVLFCASHTRSLDAGTGAISTKTSQS